MKSNFIRFRHWLDSVPKNVLFIGLIAGLMALQIAVWCALVGSVNTMNMTLENRLSGIEAAIANR